MPSNWLTFRESIKDAEILNDGKHYKPKKVTKKKMCDALTAKGEPCSSPVVKGTTKCVFHREDK